MGLRGVLVVAVPLMATLGCGESRSPAPAAAPTTSTTLSPEDDAASFAAFVDAFRTCMEVKGYTVKVVEDPAIEFDGEGALVQYGPGDEQDPNFAAARVSCRDEGRTVQSATLAELQE